MRTRTLGALATAALAAASLSPPGPALARPDAAEAPLVAADRAPRTHRATSIERARPAAAGLAGWTAIWDRDTDVPLRLWGRGEPAPGAVADPALAEAAARRFLAAHLAVLAPGATPADFELAANARSRTGDVRSVGFVQRARGLRVAGGAIGFSFKADRLALVASTALPHVTAAPPAARLAPAAAAARATAWLAAAGHAVTAVEPPGLARPERVILPIVRPRTAAGADITYRVAETVTVAATAGPGRWDVWVDAASGDPIARRSLVHYATGAVLFDVSLRHPLAARAALPSSLATHTVDGVATTAALDGTLTWAGAGAATVQTGLVGPVVRIINQVGALATATLALPAGGTATWSLATSEQGDAQLTAFVHANAVKQFAKARLAPGLPWLDRTLEVYVNESGTCNAYSTGDDIHFFRANQQCQNTGRMADVVYHEFGHSLHINSIIEGVGQFDGALSEGVSDFLASLLTNDAGVGRGFFFSSTPLRNIDPSGREKRWPEDTTGVVHDDGEIIAGTLWDLRAALEAKLGAEAGFERTLDIYYALLQRASDIPSTYAEALLADDDDGDLSNGTPNQCQIDAAFGAHGLADPAVTLGLVPPVRDGLRISLTPTGGIGTCPRPSIAAVTAVWKRRGDATTTQLPLAAAGGSYEAALPAQPEGTVVQYRVEVALSDGTVVSYPNNRADPFYELYVGPVEVVRCFDFEGGLDGWTHGASVAERDEWEVGAPAGLGGDPAAAYGGTGVLGVDLTRDGDYLASTRSYAESPEIDLGGRTAVRLQLRRWLTVEDGFFDRARILANGTEVWANRESIGEQAATVHHTDREWRFVDVDLAAQAAAGKVQLRFELYADGGFELGGWTLDDVCIVAATGIALTCGDGAVDAGETCDDGNRASGDGCSADCADEADPTPADGGGCCGAGSRPAGALGLSLATLALLARRRRRA